MFCYCARFHFYESIMPLNNTAALREQASLRAFCAFTSERSLLKLRTDCCARFFAITATAFFNAGFLLGYNVRPICLASVLCCCFYGCYDFKDSKKNDLHHFLCPARWVWIGKKSRGPFNGNSSTEAGGSGAGNKCIILARRISAIGRFTRALNRDGIKKFRSWRK